MWDNIVLAESQSFQKKRYGENCTITSQEDGQPSFPDQSTCKNSGVSQWVAYGNVVVKRHHQQDPWLRDEGGRVEKNLSDAAIQGGLPSTEPEDGQGLGNYAGGEDNICRGQHAEEEVHGFIEAALGEDNADEQAVPKQGDDIGNAEGHGNPHVLVLKARDAQ